MKTIILLTSLLFVRSAAFAKPPKISGKPIEILKKCIEWAEKETADIKDAIVKSKALSTKGEEGSFANGVDPKGK